MSNKITPEERKLKTKELRLKHQPVFNALGIPDAIFVPKMAYNDPIVAGQLVMGFFESELAECTDIYTEMVSFNMDPEDVSRTLYKYRANPHFRGEYHNKPTGSGYDRYLVPVSELIPIEGSTINLNQEPVLSDDMPIGELTAKDLAALITGKPISKKSWINELVGQSAPQKAVTAKRTKPGFK